MLKKILFLFVLFALTTQAQWKFWGWYAIQDSISRINLQSQSTTQTITYMPDSTVFQTVWQLDTAKINLYNAIGAKQNTISNIGDTSLYAKTTAIPDTNSLSNRIDKKLDAVDSSYGKSLLDAKFNNKVSYSDSTIKFYTPTQSNSKVNYSDSTVKFITSTQLKDKIAYSDTVTKVVTPTSMIYYLQNQYGIAQLAGVNISTPSVGQSLVYDGGQWVNQTITGGGSGSTGNPDSLRSHDGLEYMLRGDSLTKYYTVFDMDSAKGNIRNTIGSKFNTSDTSAFNSKGLTTAQLALKQNTITNLADTSKYFKTVDTTAFNSKTLTTAQLALKQNTIPNIGDTTKYFKKVDTTQFYQRAQINGYLNAKQNTIPNIGDTSKYFKKIDTTQFYQRAQVDGYINGKQNTIPNLSDTTKYFKKIDTTQFYQRAEGNARYAYKGLYGTATITNDTVITVTHGYGSTPPVVMLTMANNSLGVIPYVDALGATTFRIHCCIQGNYTIFWFIPKN